MDNKEIPGLMDEAASSDLVGRLRAGDDAAWREYIRSHGRLILAAGRRVGLAPADRDEAFQMSCVEACRSIASLRDPSKLASWTYSIAFRSAIKVRRRKGPEVSADGTANGSILDVLASDEPSPEDVAIRIDQAARLRAGLETLSAPCRRLVEALYLQTPQPSYQEIGKRLKLPIGSIGPTRARCLEKLKKALSAVSDPAPRGTYRAESAGSPGKRRAAPARGSREGP